MNLPVFVIEAPKNGQTRYRVLAVWRNEIEVIAGVRRVLESAPDYDPSNHATDDPLEELATHYYESPEGNMIWVGETGGLADPGPLVRERRFFHIAGSRDGFQVVAQGQIKPHKTLYNPCLVVCH